MSKDKPKSDYEVGYGKPPVATRFKPGQSGNPKGAKRKVRPSSISEALQIALLKRETVIIDGKRRRMSRLEIISERMVVNAAKGDLNARQEILKMEQFRTKLESQTARKSDTSQVICPLLSGPISILGMATKEEWNGKETQAGRHHREAA